MAEAPWQELAGGAGVRSWRGAWWQLGWTPRGVAC